MKRAVSFVICICLLFAGGSVSAAPYRSYTYNAYGEAVYSPDMYEVSLTRNGAELGFGALNQPTDIFGAPDGSIYITDCKNNRILKLSSELEAVREYKTFSNGGETLTLNSPTNVFVTDDGKIYISDNGNKRIVICDGEGSVIKILKKPSSELFPQDKEFLPMDLVVTGTGILYVLCDGIYQGAVVFDEKGEFSGFFGSNTVEATLKVIAESFWKKIATKEQRSKLARYVPVQYSAMAIDDEDFVYTTVASTDDPKARIRKLNPLGNNVLTGVDNKSLYFGDREKYVYAGKDYVSSLESVAICGGSMIAALDRTGSKVFLYSQDGDLLSVFGGSGNYKGCFVDPVSLCFNGTDIVVLDTKKGEITSFSITEYGEKLLAALEVYMDGRYAESLDMWQEVLRYSAGSYLANLGYGKALYQLGEYEEAMKYFEMAGDTDRYSEAYKEYRNYILRENFGLIAAAAVVFIVLITVSMKMGWFKRLFEFIRLKLGRRGKGI